MSEIEVDGTERLREVSDSLEDRGIHVEWETCSCGVHLKSVHAPTLKAGWHNVSLADECDDEARQRSVDRAADWAIDDARLVG